MKSISILDKLETQLEKNVSYYVQTESSKIHLNDYIGFNWKIKFEGKIFCTNCGKKTKKSFSQGHCYPCSIKLASCDMCILKPETCHFHLGTCREPDWGLNHCFKPHIVYLSYTSGFKVGITRKSQVPYRWIDQGATQASMLYEVKDRLTSGRVEVALKEFLADKTDFRKMLKSSDIREDFLEVRKDIIQKAKERNLSDVLELPENLTTIQFPITKHPEKINSFNLDKTPEISSELKGIKGQYLIFESGVLNVRSFSGYQVEIDIEEKNAT